MTRSLIASVFTLALLRAGMAVVTAPTPAQASCDGGCN
ncbi:hypothetical protein J2X36_004250 [Methylobacterium sp. BE186]|nr:hypothetical protein [Methylobacterium sp. BE186]